MLTEEKHLARYQALLGTLDRHRGTLLAPGALGSAKVWSDRVILWIAVGMVALACGLTGVLLGVVFSAGAWPLLWMSGVCVVLGAFVSHPSQQNERQRATIVKRLLCFFGMRFELDNSQAKWLAEVASQHPPIDAACVRWIAYNKGHTLTWREYHEIVRLAKRINRQVALWKEQQSRNEQAAAIQHALNAHQMVDRGRAIAQQGELEASTVEAKARPIASRL